MHRLAIVHRHLSSLAGLSYRMIAYTPQTQFFQFFFSMSLIDLVKEKKSWKLWMKLNFKMEWVTFQLYKVGSLNFFNECDLRDNFLITHFLDDFIPFEFAYFFLSYPLIVIINFITTCHLIEYIKKIIYGN